MEAFRIQGAKQAQVEAHMLTEVLKLEGTGAGIASGGYQGEEAKMRRVAGKIEGLQPHYAMAACQAHGRGGTLGQCYAAARTFERQCRRRIA